MILRDRDEQHQPPPQVTGLRQRLAAYVMYKVCSMIDMLLTLLEHVYPAIEYSWFGMRLIMIIVNMHATARRLEGRHDHK